VINPNDVIIRAWPDRNQKRCMGTGTIVSGVRIDHPPTGMVICCNKSRHQHVNRANALALLELALEEVVER